MEPSLRIDISTSFMLVLAYAAMASAHAAAVSAPVPPSAVAGTMRPPATGLHPPGVQGLHLAGTGSGFFIGPDRVLTNFHVAGSCKALTVGNNREGQEADAELVAGEAGVDLAVLSTTGAGETPALFDTDTPLESGVHLAIVGYPAFGRPVLDAQLEQASVMDSDALGDRRFYSFIGAVRGGNSGGPALDEKGAVVGVVTAKINTPAMYRKTGILIKDIGFAIPNGTIFDFLRRNSIAFGQSKRAANLAPAQILQVAHGFVRQIGCWK
jgi:S1-C subfamily serine protease